MSSHTDGLLLISPQLVLSAAKSSEVVSSLFPDRVRSKVLEQTKTNMRAAKDKQIEQDAVVAELYPNTTVRKLQTLMGESRRAHNCCVDVMCLQCQCIFRLTISGCISYTVFADIAGFTSWSSTRTPEQVFHLLEAAFGVLDDLAKRTGVYKVCTILPSTLLRHTFSEKA